jgi:hypothetical protein
MQESPGFFAQEAHRNIGGGRIRLASVVYLLIREDIFVSHPSVESRQVRQGEQPIESAATKDLLL